MQQVCIGLAEASLAAVKQELSSCSAERFRQATRFQELNTSPRTLRYRYCATNKRHNRLGEQAANLGCRVILTQQLPKMMQRVASCPLVMNHRNTAFQALQQSDYPDRRCPVQRVVARRHAETGPDAKR